MPLQSNTNVTLRYGAESTFGTAVAAGGTSQLLRRVSTGLSLTKDAFQSNEVRSDQQVFDSRHGTRRVTGGLQGELSTATYDAFMEAVLRGTWAAGVSVNLSTFTNVTATTTAFVASAGSFITSGFKVGDVVRLAGFSHANVGKNFRITALTATNMSVTPAPATMTAQTTGTIAVQGRKLTTGTQIRSFTIEQNYPDADISELFTGCRLADMAVSLPPTGMATINFNVQGQNGQILSGASAPYFTSPTAETSTGVLAGVNGSLTLAGAASAVVTGLDFTVNNNMNSQPVVGAVQVPDIFYGRTTIQGTVSAYLESETLLNAFLNETEIDIVAQLDDANLSDFLCFRFHRVKLNGVSKTIGADGGVLAQFPFQSLLRTGGSGTIYDQSGMVIQRSNV